MTIRVLLYPFSVIAEVCMLVAVGLLIVVDAAGSIVSTNARRAAQWLVDKAQKLPDPPWYANKPTTSTEKQEK